MADGIPMVNDSESTGSRLPAEVPWSGTQSGLGLKPDLESLAGLSVMTLPSRPARAIANDAAFTHGVIMEGQINGEIDPQGMIPC